MGQILTTPVCPTSQQGTELREAVVVVLGSEESCADRPTGTGGLGCKEILKFQNVESFWLFFDKACKPFVQSNFLFVAGNKFYRSVAIFCSEACIPCFARMVVMDVQMLNDHQLICTQKPSSGEAG